MFKRIISLTLCLNIVGILEKGEKRLLPRETSACAYAVNGGGGHIDIGSMSHFSSRSFLLWIAYLIHAIILVFMFMLNYGRIKALGGAATGHTKSQTQE